MDTLTHALSGALLARATEPNRHTKPALPRAWRWWVGFWAAAFPDSDIVLTLAGPLAYLANHRGVTHSLVFLPLWGLLLSTAFYFLARKKYPWREFVAPATLGVAVHIAGDVITAFGTMVFAPFSGLRAAWPTTFIIDPYFTLILVVGLLLSAYRPARRWPSVAAFTVLVGYIGFQAVLLQRATEIGKTYVAEHQLSQARAHALPQPFSPFHWMVVIEQDEAYAYAYVNLARNERVPTPPDDAFWLKRVYASYQGAQHARWQRVSRVGEDETQRALVQSAWNAPALLPYRQFTLFAVPYRVDRTNPKTCVWFQDLRFALVGRDMPFRYGACRESERAPWAVYRVVDDVDGKEISEAVL